LSEKLITFVVDEEEDPVKKEDQKNHGEYTLDELKEETHSEVQSVDILVRRSATQTITSEAVGTTCFAAGIRLALLVPRMCDIQILFQLSCYPGFNFFFTF